MAKRWVDIDDDLIGRAQAVAGTDSAEATVETALELLIVHDTAIRHVARTRATGSHGPDRSDHAPSLPTGSSG